MKRWMWWALALAVTFVLWRMVRGLASGSAEAGKEGAGPMAFPYLSRADDIASPAGAGTVPRRPRMPGA